MKCYARGMTSDARVGRAGRRYVFYALRAFDGSKVDVDGLGLRSGGTGHAGFLSCAPETSCLNLQSIVPLS